jgi:serine/threonine protein kinase
MLTLQDGTKIDDKYEIVGTVGAGGFGSVYQARQIQFDRQVALKILNTNVLEETDGLLRFEREAKAIAGLKHKNIVSFYGYGVWQNAPYMVMEFVEGTSLQAKQRAARKLDPVRSARIMKQVCEALSCAHANGVVHRDLKPSNVMLVPGPDGREIVKLIDFGLVKLMPGYGVSNQKLTEAGCAVGTCHYMSPEQCTGGEIDSRADIYAAACILYQMVTGELPFDGDELVEIMKAHIVEPPPPLAEKAGNSPLIDALQAIVQKGMAKDPDERYQSAVDMAADLDAVIRGESGKLAVQGRTSQRMFLPKMIARKARSQWRWAAPVAAAIAAGAVVMYQMSNSKPAPTATTDNTSSLSLYDDIGRRLRQVPEDPVKIIPELEAALEQNRMDRKLDPERLAALYQRLGDSYRICGQYDKAITYYKRATKTLPSDQRKSASRWTLPIGMASAMYGLKDYTPARKMLEEYIAQRQELGYSQYAEQYAALELARIQIAMDKPKHAEQMLHTVVAKGNLDPVVKEDLRESLALASSLTKHYAAAHDLYQDLLVNGKSNRKKRVLIGLARVALGQHHADEAQMYINQLKEMLPPAEKHNATFSLLSIRAAAEREDKAEAERLVNEFISVPYHWPEDGVQDYIDGFDQIMCARSLYAANFKDLIRKIEVHMQVNHNWERIYS